MSTPTDHCGETTAGMFDHPFGPCIRRLNHPEPFHRDARGVEWRHDSGTPDGEAQRLRADRDRLQRAIDAVRRFNQLTIDNSSRAQAVAHAHDTLHLLDSALSIQPPP